MGRFWDGSFFDNVHYFHGLKLNPQFGVEGTGAYPVGSVVLADDAQFLLDSDKVSGALPERDIETLEGFRKRDCAFGRMTIALRVGAMLGVTAAARGDGDPPGSVAVTGAGSGATYLMAGTQLRRRKLQLPYDYSRVAMVAAAVLGSLRLFTGATILQATTIRGAMVLGLAPVFILGLLLRAPAAAFHLAFWVGIGAGIAELMDIVPDWMTIGDGRYAGLLGVNVWGLALSTGLFLLTWAVALARRPAPGARRAGAVVARRGSTKGIADSFAPLRTGSANDEAEE